MRLIDIYKETPDGVQLVTAGCIQTGSTDLQKAVQTKFFTMANGTVCAYPVQTAKSTMTLTLQCTKPQAAAIEAAAALGSLLFAGLRFGVNWGDDVYDPFVTGYRGFLTGSVEICEMYAKSGLYSITLPLMLDAVGATYRKPAVPAISPGALSLDETVQARTGFEMVLLPVGGVVRPVLRRKQTYFTYSDTLAIDLHLTRADSGTVEGMVPFITGSEDTAVSTDGAAAHVTGTAPLVQGDNAVFIRCPYTGCRELIVCIPVYRQAGSGAAAGS